MLLKPRLSSQTCVFPDIQVEKGIVTAMVARRTENRFRHFKTRYFCNGIFLKFRIHHHDRTPFKVKHCIRFDRQFVQTRFQKPWKEGAKIQFRTGRRFICPPGL